VRNVIDYGVESYIPETSQFLHAAPRGDLTGHQGGQAFLEQIARTFSDGDAAWLSSESVRAINARQLNGESVPVDETALWGHCCTSR